MLEPDIKFYDHNYKAPISIGWQRCDFLKLGANEGL